VNLLEGDFRKRDTLNQAVRGQDYVFHLAGRIRSPDWQGYRESNYQGTRNLVEACIEEAPELKRFIYVSSISASGPTDTPVVQTESDECRPVSDYGRTKLMGEEAVRELLTGIPWVIVRPPNILGPRQEDLLAAIRLVKRRIKPLLGNGDRQTSVCYVSDLVRGIELAATSDKAPGSIYYLTDPELYSWREIPDAIAEHLGISGIMMPLPYPVLFTVAIMMEAVAAVTRRESLLTRQQLRDLRDTYWLYDASKAEKELGFTTEIDLNKGIELSIDWYRDMDLL
jgi:nucleoside-diphosphate-sugar epimerase